MTAENMTKLCLKSNVSGEGLFLLQQPTFNFLNFNVSGKGLNFPTTTHGY